MYKGAKTEILQKMKRVIENTVIILLSTLGIWSVSNAQDLEPRAYTRIPVNASFFLVGFTGILV